MTWRGVSTIIPVFNGGGLLTQAIGSVCEQDVAGMEVIVLDDGSQDHSWDLIVSCSDPRIRSVRHANMGLAATLNRGISLARGRYIARQDQDDLALPGRLAKQFGPCVATTPEAAARLANFGTAYGPTFWDLFPGNPQAVQLAHSFGFTPARKLLRMSYQGRDLDQDPEKIYALAGFEWG